MKYPVEVIPSDQLWSRCYKGMEKRLLTVYNVWKVKNLMHQVMTTKKRKQVGTDLYMFEDVADKVTATRGGEKYLAMLHKYLLALSTAGSNKMQGAPADETLGSGSTKYAKVPWDVLQTYYLRASRSVTLIQEVSRLLWLETKDVAEQAQWVSQFREGEESLGQVVRAIMEKRDAHWEVPIQSIAGHPTFSPQPPPVRDPKKPRRTNPPKTAPPANPRKMVPRSDRRSSARWKEAMPRLQQTQMQHQGSVVCQEVSQAC